MKEIIENAWPKSMASNLLNLDLQFFADPTDPVDPPAESPNNPSANPNPEEEKLYSKTDVEKIVKDRMKRADKEKAKAIEEAERLAKMNEEQKKEYEFKKLQEELEDLKKRDTFNSMSKEASKMLAEKDIVADDELLSFVVKETAEDTQTAVNSVVSIINKKVEEGVKRALAGKPPKVTSANGKPLTKNDIMAEKDTVKRLKLIEQNRNLFNN